MKMMRVLVPLAALLLSGCWYGYSRMPASEADAIKLGTRYQEDVAGKVTFFRLTPGEGKSYIVFEQKDGETAVTVYDIIFDRLANGIYLGQQHPADEDEFYYFLLKPSGSNLLYLPLNCDADTTREPGVTFHAEDNSCEFDSYKAVRAAALKRIKTATGYRQLTLQP